jgi:hypothetical protein
MIVIERFECAHVARHAWIPHDRRRDLTNIRRQNLALKPKGSGRAAELKTLCVMPTSA